MPQTTPHIIARPFQGETDFWRIRDLLIETFPITGVDFNWDIRRWDGWRFYGKDTITDPRWVDLIHVWETEDGQLVGAVHTESNQGDVYLELHPDYRQTIEADMIAWAEEHLTAPTENGRQRIVFFVQEYDAPRHRLLEQRGYEKTTHGGMVRRLHFGNRQFPQPELAAGYTLRTTYPQDEYDYQRLADLLNAAFNRTIHNAEEFRLFAGNAPCFSHDLHLVAVASDGTFAAHVAVIYDVVNRHGVFEPVCTHPDHRQRKLAQTLMFECLHRLKALGAASVTVATGDAVPANRLYASIGFFEAYRGYVWRKVI